MTDLQIGILGLVILLILIILGMRVAYAVTIVGALGVIMIQGWSPGTKLIGYLPSSEVGSYTYSAIPLFVLMGYFTYYAGIADDLFKTARAWIQHIRGGLPIATVIASAGFATVSGASTASTSVLGKIAIPQMLNSGVDKKTCCWSSCHGRMLSSTNTAKYDYDCLRNFNGTIDFSYVNCWNYTRCCYCPYLYFNDLCEG